jgi:transposase
LGRETTRSKNHVLKLLAARGHVYREGMNWTRGHWTWLRALPLGKHDRSALDRYLARLEFTLAQREELTREIDQIATTDRYRVGAEALRCLFGIESIQAMTLMAETCDFRRFPNARRYASYLGLPPGEYSSGGKTRHGAMSKTGNAHCRRVLVSAARHYSRPPRPSQRWTRRHGGQPAHVVEHAWKCRRRLHQRYWHLVHRKGAGASNKAVVAIARELSGFVWALMVEIEETLGPNPMPSVA